MKRPKFIIVGNWKMNPANPEEARRIFGSLKRLTKNYSEVKTVICPPSVFLSILNAKEAKNLSLGVQDVFWQSAGPFTGEISAEMARNSGAEFSIIGHSERRALGETDEIVSKKVLTAVEAGLFAIVCVGEKNRDAAGDYFKFLKDELEGSLQGLKKKFFDKIIIAYEPVWAIGKSFKEAMKPNDIHETSLFIRKVLTDMYGSEWVSNIPILYGGSVSFESAGPIVHDGKVNGLLVGRESLNPEGFKGILEAVNGL